FFISHTTLLPPRATLFPYTTLFRSHSAGHSLSLAGSCLRREYRLSCPARTEPERDPCVSPGVCLGSQSRTHLRAGSYRFGQELCGFGTGAESLPGWLSGLLHGGRRHCSGI